MDNQWPLTGGAWGQRVNVTSDKDRSVKAGMHQTGRCEESPGGRQVTGGRDQGLMGPWQQWPAATEGGLQLEGDRFGGWSPSCDFTESVWKKASQRQRSVSSISIYIYLYIYSFISTYSHLYTFMCLSL